MSVHQLDTTQANHPFVGTWHIYEMSEWDEDYFNMETQASTNWQSQIKNKFKFWKIQRQQAMRDRAGR